MIYSLPETRAAAPNRPRRSTFTSTVPISRCNRDQSRLVRLLRLFPPSRRFFGSEASFGANREFSRLWATSLVVQP